MTSEGILRPRVAISADFFTAFSAIPRQKQSKVVDFINKFRNNPMSSGINYEKIINAFDSNLRSVRIDETYRGIVLKPDISNVYLLLWVDNHDDAYKWAVRKKCIINSQTGSIQVFDVQEEAEVIKIQNKEYNIPGLFDEISDSNLVKIGVPEEIIPIVREVHNIEELDSNINKIPQDSYEALYFLATGYSLEDVINEFATEEKDIDTNDFNGALNNINTLHKFIVLDNDDDQKELKEILSAPLEKWRVFLHPTQRKIVEKNFNGPTRVLGGAGTGKTVVAMHRAKWLVENSFTNRDERILFTTFTKNLSEDIKENLKKICTPETMKRIDVMNIDSWVADFLKKHDYNYRIIYSSELDQLWNDALTIAPSEVNVPVNFYRDEWEKVIIPNGITTKAEYLKIPRLGRGIRLDRKARDLVWDVFDEFKTSMNQKAVRDIDTAMMEAKLILENKGDILPYKAVIVDESQDLGIQAFKLIRQIAGDEHQNDIFIVGDSHQRIYRNKVVLSKCGINIKGRSHRLKINYRTTEETRDWAFKLLNGIKFDDLDTGIDDGKGYKSLVHGPKPEIVNFANLQDEVNYLATKINELREANVTLNSICIVARTDKQLSMYADYLHQKDIRTYKIKRTEAEDRYLDGVRIATMHRVKGLEFDYVFLAGINEGIVPLNQNINEAVDNVSKRERITSERSLLYVAATRAKKAVFVTSYGVKSGFLD
ncbi:MAG: 3'-5' exonuclease [Clostridium celatum]|nr:3'-5' exonuclease [Clostridium celatum]